jgi:hypothetical protein
MQMLTSKGSLGHFYLCIQNKREDTKEISNVVIAFAKITNNLKYLLSVSVLELAQSTGI